MVVHPNLAYVGNEGVNAVIVCTDEYASTAERASGGERCMVEINRTVNGVGARCGGDHRCER